MLLAFPAHEFLFSTLAMAGAISMQPEGRRGSTKRKKHKNKKKKTYLNGNRSQKIGLWLQEGKEAMVHTVFTVRPFHWEEDGVGVFVDLGSTKRALSLSRELNPSTEKQVLMGNSLSSTAIQPPWWKAHKSSPGENQRLCRRGWGGQS